MTRRIPWTALRIGATVTLLAVLIGRADLAALAANLAAADPRYLAAAGGLLALRNLVQAARWQATLRAWGQPVPLTALLRLVLVGHFFTVLLPTATGGDLARWSLLARRGGGKALAGQSVVADRILGLAGLGALLAAVLPWSWDLVASPWLRHGLLAVLPATVAMLVAVLRPGWLPAAWRRRLPLVRARRDGWIGVAMALSVLTHGVAILLIVALGRSVGDATGLRVYGTLLPLVWLLSMLPIAIGGLGVREAGFVALFVAAGMPETLAATIAGLWLCVTLVQAALGGLLLLGLRRAARVAAATLGSPASAAPLATRPAGEAATVATGAGAPETPESLACRR